MKKLELIFYCLFSLSMLFMFLRAMFLQDYSQGALWLIAGMVYELKMRK